MWKIFSTTHVTNIQKAFFVLFQKHTKKGGELQAIPGTPPDLMEPPVGCPFAARCKETMIVCQKYMPDYTDCGKNHKSACWMLDEMAQEVNSDEK